MFWTVERVGAGWVSGDSGEWRDGATAEQVKRNVLKAVDALGSGTILVHHCGSRPAAEALPSILGEVRQRPYEIGPVSALPGQGPP